MHINTHKTFSTPHGGGGPGAGPVGVGEKLRPFLPSPLVLREPDGTYRLERAGERPTSIGRLRSYAASTGVLVRAFAYIFAHGGSGLEEVTDDAVLAANYLKARLAGTYDIPYPRHCMHEFVASAATIKKETGVRTLDIAKRLIDYGFHPPTIYFPLIVDEGMLIEPTETEPIETLDAFADALIAIAGRGAHGPRDGEGRRRSRRRSAASTRRPRRATPTCAGAPRRSGPRPSPEAAAPHRRVAPESSPVLPARAVQRAAFVRNTDRGGRAEDRVPEFYEIG